MERLERLEDVSMAFLVVLERLTPAERAVLLLHDVLDLAHEEIAVSLARTPASCRKLLERARSRVAAGRKLATASRAEHARLLDGFVRAASAGDATALAGLLAEDAVLVTDGGPEGRTFGRYKNLRRPLHGRERIASLVARTSRRAGLEVVRGELNGEPAVILTAAGRPAAAILVAAHGGAIARVWFCADAARLRHVGDAQRRQPSRKRRKSSRAIG